MNSAMFRIIGIVFIISGLFIDDIVKSLTFVNEVEIIQLGLSQPTDEISSSVSEISDIITDTEDRLAMAIFNKVCIDRINNWPEFNQQDFNDIYVGAAKNFFGDSMKDKYEGLDKFLIKVMIDITGDDIHNLSISERQELINKFNGIAWHLIK